MKKHLIALLVLVLLAAVSFPAMADYDPQEFITWMENGGSAGANTPAFLSGAENKPTKDDMETMLKLANTYFQCHGLTGTHFVVIQDEAEQEEIMQLFVNFVGLDCSGTNMVLVMADGVKDQEHHAAPYYPGTTQQNGGNPEYWNMYFGIYEAGWASGYLNLVATSLGYRTRAYAALNIPNAETGAVDLYGTGGNFAYINGENWDIAKYMTSKDGSEQFDHYVLALDDTIPCEGNVTLLCAIIVGKIDETDAVTGATQYSEPRMQNYDFWDWDDNYAANAASVGEADVQSAATQTAE